MRREVLFVGTMNPRVVVIAGPLKDSVFELGEGEELSVGRDSTNRVRLADSSLSRRHCLIRRAADRVLLTDLESLNGTFVNGRPVREHTLADGDLIGIGDSRLVFLTTDGEAPAHNPNPVRISERHMTAHSTVRLKVEDALYLRPDSSAGLTLASMARDLALLIRVSTSVNSVRDVEGLQRELLK
ncbi:MAG TPA: FHA domain-containing protein, partial [Pyrinomonadaceae bacterium]|nr:FHA domain-containing protein [Pyrinomonadaceae bacterium]